MIVSPAIAVSPFLIFNFTFGGSVNNTIDENTITPITSPYFTNVLSLINELTLGATNPAIRVIDILPISVKRVV